MPNLVSIGLWNVRYYRMTLHLIQNYGETAQLCIISENGRGQSCPVSVRAFANKCFTIATAVKLEAWQVVTVEHADALFLGEVVRCRTAQGSYEADIQVEQTLTSLQSLGRLRDALLGFDSLASDLQSSVSPPGKAVPLAF